MKAEVGQFVDVFANPRDGNGIQPGTAVWTATAKDNDGNDVEIDSTPVPGHEQNELGRRFKPTNDVECITTVELNADGDRDIDEEAPCKGTLVIVFDEKNTTVFDMVGVAGTPEPPPVETPVETPVAEPAETTLPEGEAGPTAPAETVVEAPAEPEAPAETPNTASPGNPETPAPEVPAEPASVEQPTTPVEDDGTEGGGQG